MSRERPHAPSGCRIGDAARASGVASATIRFYERQGLLAPSGRADNDYRLYSAADVHRLRFIRLCRALDMSLDEVRALLSLDAGRPEDCAAADATLAAHLGHVRERIAELRLLERQLHALRRRCTAVPATGRRCGLIESLHRQAAVQPGEPTPAAPRRRTSRHV